MKKEYQINLIRALKGCLMHLHNVGVATRYIKKKQVVKINSANRWSKNAWSYISHYAPQLHLFVKASLPGKQPHLPKAPGTTGFLLQSRCLQAQNKITLIHEGSLFRLDKERHEKKTVNYYYTTVFIGDTSHED